MMEERASRCTSFAWGGAYDYIKAFGLNSFLIILFEHFAEMCIMVAGKNTENNITTMYIHTLKTLVKF